MSGPSFYEVGLVQEFNQNLEQWRAAVAERDRLLEAKNETIRQLRAQVAKLDELYRDAASGQTAVRGWNKGGISLIKDLVAENAACPHKHTYTDLNQTREEHQRRAHIEVEKLNAEIRAAALKQGNP